MNKFALLVASLFVSLASFAQWTKPTAPAVAPMAIGEELYLYNKEADGFLVGANDWGTRASVSPTLGHKVYIENGTADGSYYITNYVLQGGMANQIGYMFIEGVDAIWVDNTKDGKANNQYTFEAQGGGTYKIGLSEKNAEYNPNDYVGAYLGLIPSKGDTRIYICDPENSAGYTMDECQLIWYFVAPAAYATYSEAMKQYLAAVALGESIDEAVALGGVNADVLSAAQAAYANTSSTPEDMEAQKKALDAAIFEAKLAIATVDNPVDVLLPLGIASDFNDSDFTGWKSTTGASNKQASNGNNAKDYSVTGNHYENWNWDAFSIGKVSATATGLPTGIYHLNTLAYTTTVGGTFLYAGGNQKMVTATQIDIEKPMDIYAVVTDGTLEFGLDVQEKGTNWIGLDNVHLYYLGNAAEAYEVLVSETLGAEPDYETQLSKEAIYCQVSVYESYKTAVDALRSAKTADEVAQALSTFNAASKAMAQSVAAYQAFANKFNEADAWLNSTTSESDEVNLLADYLMDESAAEGDYNGHGGALYVLAEGLLDNAQIADETAYLDRIMKDAMANAMSDGDDCTGLLKNPKFAEQGGWTSAVGPTWPEGDTEKFPVMQASNMVCDVYQELNNLQNGLYEFGLSAAFRPGDSYTEENEAVAQAYAYINSFETKIPSGKIEDDVTLNEPAEASVAFADGKFSMKVYGLVTDGTMKLGITNKVRSVEGCRLWAGGASLIFRGKNADVLAQVIAQTTPAAQALLSNYAGRPELDALSAAIADAQNTDDAYASFIELKKAMEAVEEGTTLYVNFSVALKSLSDAIANASSASASTISKAKEVLATAQNAYDSQAYNNTEVEQAISDLNATVVSIKMGGSGASEDNPVDYSDMIVNNNFDPARGDKNAGTIEGWTTTAMNGYKEYTVSYNRAAFELNQKLSGLPKGKYKVTVHTYYRAGYYDEEEQRIAAGTETHLTTLYAKTSADNFTTPVMNLCEGATTEVPEGASKYYTLSDGKFAPDGTSPTAAWFAAGYYLNELVFTVPEDGEVTIGLSKTEVFANDYEVVGEWNLWYMGDPEEAQEDVIDMSDIIVNPNFDPARGDKNESRIEGWTTTALNGYKEYTCSYNRAPFELYQDLSGLPAGKYRATVHTYYRAGYWDEEEQRIAAGTDTHLTTLYAETAVDKFTTPVMNLTEGAVAASDAPEGVNVYTLSNGLVAPDGTTPTAAFFKAGYYLNTIEFEVGADGKARIGLSKTEVFANDYEVVGEWKLYFIKNGGEPVAIEGLQTADAAQDTPVAFYTLSGARLAAPQKGVNIVKMKNGQVKKVFIK